MDLKEYDSHRRTAHTASGDVSYVDVGTGRPALFVHGVGTNAYLWRNVIGELAGERRCIALDLPLHGHSPIRPDQDLTLPGLAQVVEDLCAELDLTGLDLVANDTGGAVSQVFAVHHKERLATFTLTNCETHDNIPPKAFKPTVLLARTGLLALMGPRMVRDPAKARANVFGKGYQYPDRLSDEMLLAYLEPVLGTKERARQFQRWVSSLHAKDLLAVEPELRKLEVPTLVAWGTDDAFFETRWAYWLRDTIPGVTEVVEIDGAHLFYPDERAAELVPHLRRHWEKHPAH
ncbi:MAG: alpha/beta hydrolase [Actinocatenispora sp.]